MKKKSMILAGIVAAVVLCAVIVSACLPNAVERVYWECRLLGKTQEEVERIIGQTGLSPYSFCKVVSYSVGERHHIIVDYGSYSGNGKAENIIIEHREGKIIDDEFDHGFH